MYTHTYIYIYNYIHTVYIYICTHYYHICFLEALDLVPLVLEPSRSTSVHGGPRDGNDEKRLPGYPVMEKIWWTLQLSIETWTYPAGNTENVTRNCPEKSLHGEKSHRRYKEELPADLKQKLLEVKEKLPDQFVDLHLGPIPDPSMGPIWDPSPSLA